LKKVAAGGLDLVVREWGDEDGRPLVFWHGLNPFGALQLNEAGPAWGERGFRVLAPAAPGMGDSPPLSDLEDYRPTRLAHLVVEIADAIGLDRFAYAGWSWGASIGVHLAARHTDRLVALVLLDAGHTDAQDMQDWVELSLDDRIAQYEERPVSFSSWDALLAFARERWAAAWRPALEERLRAGMHEDAGAVVARGDLRAAAAALHGVAVERPSSTLPALARLGLPILLVVADENDTANAVRRFRSAVAHADVRSVASDHDVLAGAPEETARLVGDWLLEQSV
jgi:pimeloyl-ACP methyl ester carboxylesterase